MAYAYIASRPVRFDKDYAIGEIIPESVIDPRMTSKLEGMGKITKIELPEEGGKQEAQNAPQSGADLTADGGEAAEGTNIPSETENAPTGENEAPEEGGKQEAQNEEFKCEKCGKVFKTANALTAHSRTHKK
ncbi:MAG: C2H2-type zinc finger protein [Lachnospiraceae bacterium]|nr:C2H2-type zinc finger protein [Lachnospiraceae bacterium]